MPVARSRQLRRLTSFAGRSKPSIDKIDPCIAIFIDDLDAVQNMSNARRLAVEAIAQLGRHRYCQSSGRWCTSNKLGQLLRQNLWVTPYGKWHRTRPPLPVCSFKIRAANINPE